LESTKLRNANSTFKTPSALRKSSGSGTSEPTAERKHPPSLLAVLVAASAVCPLAEEKDIAHAKHTSAASLKIQLDEFFSCT
jgi:hypothetical protein